MSSDAVQRAEAQGFRDGQMGRQHMPEGGPVTSGAYSAGYERAIAARQDRGICERQPLVTTDSREILALLCDAVQQADEAELPGLTSALRSVLHSDALPAEQVVEMLRRAGI
jgi:hypothetical protein